MLLSIRMFEKALQANALKDWPDLALHRVFVVAVARVEIVVNIVVRDQDVVCGIVDAVVAEMVEFIVREQQVVAAKTAPVRTLWMCDPVIEMQVV